MSLSLALGVEDEGLIESINSISAGLRKASSFILSWKGFAVGAFAVVGVAAVQAGRKAVSAAAAMDAAFREVATLLPQTAEQMAELQSAVVRLSTRVPEPPAQLTGALYQAISAGARDTADALEVVETASKAATAGLSSTETAVDAITTVLNAYQLEATEAGRVSDVLFKTVEQGKIRFDELAGSLGNAVTSAALVGVSVEELGAAIATMTKFGVDARKATTALNRLFLEVTNTTAAQEEAIEEMGIEFDVAAIKSKGLVGFLQDLQEATGGNVQELAKIIPSIRSARAAFVLAGDGAEEFQNILAETTSASGATLDAFEDQVGSLGAQLSIFGNSLNALLFESGFGQSVLGGIVDILEEWNDNMRELIDSTGQEIERLERLGLTAEAVALQQVRAIRQSESALEDQADLLDEIASKWGDIDFAIQNLFSGQRPFSGLDFDRGGFADNLVPEDLQERIEGLGESIQDEVRIIKDNIESGNLSVDNLFAVEQLEALEQAVQESEKFLDGSEDARKEYQELLLSIQEARAGLENMTRLQLQLSIARDSTLRSAERELSIVEQRLAIMSQLEGVSQSELETLRSRRDELKQTINLRRNTLTLESELERLEKVRGIELRGSLETLDGTTKALEQAVKVRDNLRKTQAESLEEYGKENREIKRIIEGLNLVIQRLQLRNQLLEEPSTGEEDRRTNNEKLVDFYERQISQLETLGVTEGKVVDELDAQLTIAENLVAQDNVRAEIEDTRKQLRETEVDDYERIQELTQEQNRLERALLDLKKQQVDATRELAEIGQQELPFQEPVDFEGDLDFPSLLSELLGLDRFDRILENRFKKAASNLNRALGSIQVAGRDTEDVLQDLRDAFNDFVEAGGDISRLHPEIQAIANRLDLSVEKTEELKTANEFVVKSLEDQLEAIRERGAGETEFAEKLEARLRLMRTVVALERTEANIAELRNELENTSEDATARRQALLQEIANEEELALDLRENQVRQTRELNKLDEQRLQDLEEVDPDQFQLPTETIVTPQIERARELLADIEVRAGKAKDAFQETFAEIQTEGRTTEEVLADVREAFEEFEEQGGDIEDLPESLQDLAQLLNLTGDSTQKLSEGQRAAIQDINSYRRAIINTADALGIMDDSTRQVLNSTAAFAEAGIRFAGGDIAGGIVQAASGIGGLISALSGPSEREKVVQENTSALRRLKEDITKLRNVLSDLPGRLLAIGDELARVVEEIPENFGPLPESMLPEDRPFGTTENEGIFGGEPEAVGSEVEDVLDRLGITLTDLERVADSTGVSIDNLVKAVEEGEAPADAVRQELIDLNEAMQELRLDRFFESFTGQMDLLQREMDLFDVDNPIEELQKTRDVFLEFSNLPEEIQSQFANIDLSTTQGRKRFEKLIQRVFTQFRDGELGPEALGQLSAPEFLEALANQEGLLDEIAENTGETRSASVDRSITEVTGVRMVGLLTTQVFWTERVAHDVRQILGRLGGGITPPSQSQINAANAGTTAGIELDVDFGDININVEDNDGVLDADSISQSFLDVLTDEVDVALRDKLRQILRSQGITNDELSI